jgi:hypothetical protein
MDAVTALITAAQGVRRSLGDFAEPATTMASVTLIESIAAALAERARSDAAPGDPDEYVTTRSLLVSALEHRVADLFDDDASRDACTLTHTCPPDCNHVAVLLVASDRAVHRFVRASQMRNQYYGYRQSDDQERYGLDATEPPDPDVAAGPFPTGMPPPDED